MLCRILSYVGAIFLYVLQAVGFYFMSKGIGVMIAGGPTAQAFLYFVIAAWLLDKE